ncbi:MAG: Ig-like domain-containing protein [Erysipelotrichaceae bacterium]|nr:Ig-like domain-containing protein [Erysipelotrichaceae bacterium]
MAKKKEIKETETTVTEQEPEKEEKKNNKGLIFLLIGLLVIAAVAGTLFFLNAKVTVTFDSDGGSAVAAEKVKKGECVNQPGDPTKEGFDFMGWYLGDQKYDFATPVTNSITIKAGWEKSKYVTFLVDGKEYAKEHIVNGKITFPENPTMDGFAFIEWQKGAGEAISESDVFDQDLTVSAAFRKYIPVTSIKFEKSSYVADAIGYEPTPTKLIISPDDWAENLKYTSADTSIATVSQDGKITGISAGKTTITVTTESGKTASCEVEVITRVGYIDFEEGYKDVMFVGETQILKYTIAPADATEKLNIYSTDESVLKIDKNMKVTAVGIGEARIDFDGKYMQACAIIKVIGITAPDTLTLDMGETKNIGAKIMPDNTTAGLKYKSDDEMVAKVDANGNVYGVEGGKCKIRIFTDAGLTTVITVYVNEYTLLIDLKGTGAAASLPAGTYILWYGNDRPLLKVSEATLRVTEKGVDKFVNVDISKLDLKTGTDNLVFWASKNEIYATNFSEALNRKMMYPVHWEYKYTSGGKTRTIKTPDFIITVEPILSVSVGATNSNANNLKWNIHYGEGTIELPATAGTHEFRITLNQEVTCTHSSNLTVTFSHPEPATGKPYYHYFDVKYSKTTSSSPGWIKFVTPGGQVIYFKSVR